MSKAIIFDFDGTLVDSEKTIKHCFQSITKLIAHERESFAKNILIGPPLRETASEILGFDYQDQLDKFVDLFIGMHDENIIKHTQPYPDVANVLYTLYKKNVLMAVATNKRQEPTIKLIDYFGWKDYFKFIECSDNNGTEIRKKDDMIQDILKNNDSINGGFFIGDTVNDGLSANLSQLKFIKATYGYGEDQDWSKVNVHKVINKFSEILELI